MGEIRKMLMPSGPDRYDRLCHDNYHARCVKCCQVFDVDLDFIVDLEKSIKNNQGFNFKGHDIIFKGICSKCEN